MDPINYMLDVKNPIEEAIKGYTMGRNDIAQRQEMQIQQQTANQQQQLFQDQQFALQDQRAAAAYQQAQAAAFQQDLMVARDKVERGTWTADAANAFKLKYAKSYEDVAAVAAAMDEPKRKAHTQYSINLSVPLLQGNKEAALKMVDERIAAAKASGDAAEVQAQTAFRQTIVSDPYGAGLGLVTSLNAAGLITAEAMKNLMDATQKGEKPTDAMRTLDGQLRAAGIVPKNEGGDGRYEAAQAKAAGAGDGEEPDLFELERKIRDEYTKLTADYRTVSQSFNRLNSAENTGPGDIALIFAYMKMLDPGSVVREGEFATASNSAGIPTAIVNAYNNAINGTRLTDRQRLDFKSQARGLLDAAQTSQRDAVDTLMPTVDKYGLDPIRIFGPPITDAVADAGTPPATTTTAQPSAGAAGAAPQSFLSSQAVIDAATKNRTTPEAMWEVMNEKQRAFYGK